MPGWAEMVRILVSGAYKEGKKGLIPSVLTGWFLLLQNGEYGSVLPLPLAPLSIPQRFCSGDKVPLLSLSSVTPSGLNRGCLLNEQHKRNVFPPPYCWELDQVALGPAPAWCGDPLGPAGACLAHIPLLWLGFHLKSGPGQGGNGVCLGWVLLGRRHQRISSPTWWRSQQ